MRAIDTNVVVRFLVNDDAAQGQRARTAVAGGDLYVATSVMLETEWVLRRAYRIPKGEVVGLLRGFIGLPGLALEDQLLIAVALERAAAGMDFADALHLGRAGQASTFLSFDRKLARVAARLGDIPVIEP